MTNSMSKRLMHFALLGVLINPTHVRYPDEITRDERLRIQGAADIRRIQLLKDKGVSEWTFDGITVIARNEKNAMRKIANIKKQLNF